MYFTQEDYKKIENWLNKRSIKDTEFQEASPLKGNEIIAVTQKGYNRKINVKDLVDQLLNLGIEDFINVTSSYDSPNISLEEAIHLIPDKARQEGQVITFLNKEGKWEIHQFTGKLNQWNNTTLWNNPFDWENYVVNSTLPDEEDLTKSLPDTAGNAYLTLKDRKYEPDKYSGLGRKIIRKRIVKVEDPIYGTKEKNLLLQDDFDSENTIYEIRYDFDLNGAEITIPEGCVLDFQGGRISNGRVVFNDTKFIGEVSLSLTSVQGLPSCIEASWFGIRQSNEDNSGLLNNLIKMLPSDEVYTINFKSGVYNFNSPIYIRDRINFIGESYVHGSDHWANKPKDECVLLFNHEEYGVISDDNTTGVNTFKNITFRAGNENAGGCNFISTIGSSSYNYNLIFDHCNFRGFAHKFGLRFSDSWRSSIDTCHFVGCGGGIGIIKGSSGENNDIMIFQCTIECCCVGIYGSGLMRNINIIGGTIEGIDMPEYNTTFPSEINVSSYILNDYGVTSQDEIRTAILITGAMIGIVEGVYFENIHTTDLFFSYESVVTIKSCIFNDLFLKENPLIAGFANALVIEGNCFYINENRNIETYLIKQNNCRSLIFLGNDFHGKTYENLISGTITSSIIQNTRGIISFKSVSTLSLSGGAYFGDNWICSGNYGLHFLNSNNFIGAFTKDSGYTNKVHTKEPTKGAYVGMYFADGVNWNPLNKTENKPYLCLWNGERWTNVDGNRLSIVRGVDGKRPNLDSGQSGYCVFDMNLDKPIWWTGSKWVDATGAEV